MDDDFDYLQGEHRRPAGTRVPGYPYGGPPRLGSAGPAGPQPRLNGTGPQPRLNGTGPMPRVNGTYAQGNGHPLMSGPGIPGYPPASGHAAAARPVAARALAPGYPPANGRPYPAYPPADGRGYPGYPSPNGRAYPGSPPAGRRRVLAEEPEPVGKRVLGRLVLLPKALPLPGQALREHRDVSGGWLRPAVFGAMDGLVTNSSLIAGIGGGGGGHGAIVLTGIAGLIAGAFSMATGEYISVTSQNELTKAEVELERLQHRHDRPGKLGRLTEIYMDKGVSPNLAEAVAWQISADEDRAVATHVREELGIDPDDLPSPRTAAAASFAAFTVGALLPLSPFLLGFPILNVALVVAGVAAIVGGAAVAKLTDRSMLLGGLRQFTAAFLATGMAFVVGHLISGHVAG